MRSTRLLWRLSVRHGHDRRVFLGAQSFLNTMQKEKFEEIRCGHCHKLLAKGQVKIVEFKCPRCGAFTIVRAERPDSEPQDGQPEFDYG